jgi:hypothetical protein
MRKRILRIVAELNIPVTIRKLPNGLLFWRSTNEDLQHAKEMALRLQTAQRKGQARRGRRQRA